MHYPKLIETFMGFQPFSSSNLMKRTFSSLTGKSLYQNVGSSFTKGASTRGNNNHTGNFRFGSDTPMSAQLPEVHIPTTQGQLLRHLSALLTRHGRPGEDIVAAVQKQLQVRYGVPDPIRTAVDAVKPVIKYYKSKVKKGFLPLALYPKTAEGMALRWIITAARGRNFTGGRPDIVKGLVDEFDMVIQGTSAIYNKRFATHRNPN